MTVMEESGRVEEKNMENFDIISVSNMENVKYIRELIMDY